MIARTATAVRLDEDDIHEVLYCVRINDQDDLDETLKALSSKHEAPEKDILLATTAEDNGNTALHFAAANGLVSILSHILTVIDLSEHPDYVNIRNHAGNTPLHWAAINGHLESTKALVNAGANLWVRNQAGNLAVFEAERVEKNDVVAYLLQAGGTEKENEDKHDELAEDSSAEAPSGNEDVESATDDFEATTLGP